jgi:tetratricopeptide (TPR) repeat protein
VRTIRLAAVLAALVATTAAPAHDDLDRQIARVTARLAADPGNASLLLRRAELHRQHRDWDRSLADLIRAEAADPSNDDVTFARGRLFRDAGWPRAALLVLAPYLAAHPDHGPAHLVRARALVDVGRFADAVSAYDDAVTHLPVRQPDHYVERARAARRAGGEHLAAAVRGLDAGMDDLGPIVTLELLAIETEVELGRHDAALARIDARLRRAPRPESWLVRRAEVLERAGRPADAAESCRAALAAIDDLPPRHRSTAATRALADRANALLRRHSEARADDPAPR